MAKSDGKRSNGNSNYYGWIVSDCQEGPSKKMRRSQWMESEQQTSSNVNFRMDTKMSSSTLEFSRNFAKINAWSQKGIKLMNKPFQVAVIDDFLSDKLQTKNLVNEIQSIEFTRKQLDLYEFYQTTDLANITTPYLKSFYNFISTDIRNWMQQITGMKFQKVSASCSMYNCGDFLLSHDDLLTDRLIAFVFYLTPWDGVEKWTEEMGGALELFASDSDGQPNFPVAMKVCPANNQFVFFKVEKKSHHQVGEVLNKDYSRLTINGWFHGSKDNPHYDADAVRVKKPNILKFRAPNDEECQFEKIINNSYLKSDIKQSIQRQIEENSEASLGEFLKPDFLSKVSEEIKYAKFCIKGPANQQNYDVLDVKSLLKTSNVLKFLNIMASKQFFHLLHEYTELDLQENSKTHPKCRVELQRWKGGCYTLIGDPSTYENDSLDLIFYIGNNGNVGIINYLTPDEESVILTEEDDESALLTVYPQNNSLNLVYRSGGTANFMKYCYKSTVMEDEFNYILVCSYKE